MNRELERKDIMNYVTDDYLGAQMIVRYATRMGHKSFGMIEGQLQFIITDDHIKQGNYLPESGYLKMKEMLTASKIPTCIFVANDDMAIGAIQACNDLGFRVPEDISILGFDDMGYTKYLVPKLTTVKKPTNELVEEGVTALTNLVTGVHVDTKKAVFPPYLVVRDSAKALRSETQA
ncbi:LacI family DNA-binding transcriptional regulator [Lentilactobacillus hilgardii]|uniref:LacI family DNA-binding transcriptional regulator n=1 Tax=Lentilactobacillus hilgardii TaxID=1588 RepID=UPI0035D0DDC1